MLSMLIRFLIMVNRTNRMTNILKIRFWVSKSLNKSENIENFRNFLSNVIWWSINYYTLIYLYTYASIQMLFNFWRGKGNLKNLIYKQIQFRLSCKSICIATTRVKNMILWNSQLELLQEINSVYEFKIKKQNKNILIEIDTLIQPY